MFKDFANSLVEQGLPKPKFLVQGTLYPDIIESCPPPGSGQKHSHTIKSHHNVGGLPKDLQFTLIEPLKELFKVSATSVPGQIEMTHRGSHAPSHWQPDGT